MTDQLGDDVRGRRLGNRVHWQRDVEGRRRRRKSTVRVSIMDVVVRPLTKGVSTVDVVVGSLALALGAVVDAMRA